MYETPELECYGNFRELTKGGGGGEFDILTPDPLDTCLPPSTNPCVVS